MTGNNFVISQAEADGFKVPANEETLLSKDVSVNVSSFAETTRF